MVIGYRRKTKAAIKRFCPPGDGGKTIEAMISLLKHC